MVADLQIRNGNIFVVPKIFEKKKETELASGLSFLTQQIATGRQIWHFWLFLPGQLNNAAPAAAR